LPTFTFQYAPILTNNWLLLADLLTNSSYGRMEKIDPGRWDKVDSKSRTNKDTIDQIVSGFTVPETKYENYSCHKTDDSRDVDWNFISQKGELYLNTIKEEIDRRDNELPGLFPKYELFYQTHLRGEDGEGKCEYVAISLFYNCLKDAKRLAADDPAFLRWLFERNLINRVEVCKIFLDITKKKIRSLDDEDREEVMKKVNELCSWNIVHSKRIIKIAKRLDG
ncbi:hypothetical protein PMAYCL1PPCAC_14582, partial [Pristionchus mayeri]